MTAGATTVCAGAGARRLGSLAALMGDWDVCERLFETALDIDRRMKSPPWLAHSEAAFAAALREPIRTRDAFEQALERHRAQVIPLAERMVALTSMLERQAA